MSSPADRPSGGINRGDRGVPDIAPRDGPIAPVVAHEAEPGAAGGTVLALDRDVAHVAPLLACAMGERVDFDGGGVGIALALRRDGVRVALLDRGSGVEVGTRARASGAPLAAPEDGVLWAKGRRPIVAAAPGAVARDAAGRALLTGTKALDILAPLSRGHRLLVIGPRGSGKSDLLVTAAAAQGAPGSELTCIFVSVGRTRDAGEVLRARLARAGASATLVLAPMGAPAATKMLAPLAAMALAERERDAGRDVLLCFDGVASCLEAFRDVTSALTGIAVARVHPAEAFSHLAALLDRAGQLDAAHGGRAISVIASLEGSLNEAPSLFHPAFITDLLVCLEAERFRRGQRPAIVPVLGLSKLATGCARPLRRHATSIRLTIAQLESLEREVPGLKSLGQPLDAVTRALIAEGRRLWELLAQPPGRPVGLETLTALAVAVACGATRELPEGRAAAFEKALEDEVRRRVSPGEISVHRQLEEETVKKLQQAGRAAAALVSSGA